MHQLWKKQNMNILLYHNKYQSGYVLIMVLVFLQIFSMLGLYALSNAMLLKKTSYEYWRKQDVTVVR
jgi:Tfp pilus assembly protein PilX